MKLHKNDKRRLSHGIMDECRPRITDAQIELKLESFGAVLIVGPNGCGKTTTAKKYAKSSVDFRDEKHREGYLKVSEIQPSNLLKGDKPRLFEEWQDAPKIWGTVRKSVDEERTNGLYILTGTPSNNVNTPHTGTSRISTLEMYPMSLFESGESDGSVSLEKLFKDGKYDGCESKLDIDGLIFAICRGGWPYSLSCRTEKSKLEVAKDLFRQACQADLSSIDGVHRDPKTAESVLRSYSRSICSLTDSRTILNDMNSECKISRPTLNSYLYALQNLRIIEEVNAWCPRIRSSSAIRSKPMRNLVDPSLAVAALNLKPESFDTDFRMLRFLFKSLCIRDLKVYSSKVGGELSYYHDRYGLKADCVLKVRNDHYALINFELGSNGIDNAAKHLLKIEELIKEHNKEEKQVPLRLPDLKIIITGTKYGYRRDNGVLVIPIGCLRD